MHDTAEEHGAGVDRGVEREVDRVSPASAVVATVPRLVTVKVTATVWFRKAWAG